MPASILILRFGTLEWAQRSDQVVCRSRLRRRLQREGGGYFTDDQFWFEWSTEGFGPTVEAALEAARKAVDAGDARLDGAPLAGLRLAGVEAAFDERGEVRDGRLRFEGRLGQAPAFPFAFEGPADEFFEALSTAASMMDDEGIVAENILETPEYWVFPSLMIGGGGSVLFDRRTKRTACFGSSMPIERWLWGYERGLFVGNDGDLVVTDVHDRARTVYALRRLGVGFKSWHLVGVPFVLRGAASWTAIDTLYNAGDAFAWHVERPAAGG